MSTLTELRQVIKDIDKKATKEKNLLMLEYAKTKREYRIGDIISNGTTTIRIDVITWGSGQYSYDIDPYSQYEGVELTKKMIPRKDGNKGYLADTGNRYPIKLIKKGEV